MMKELADLLENERERVWTICLAVIKKVDLTKFKATVQPKTKIYNSSTGKYTELPEIEDCPILALKGSSGALMCAPSAGDIAIVLFSYFPLDGQLKDSDMSNELLRRRQSYADAFVFSGLFLDDEELPEIAEGEVALVHTGGENPEARQKVVFGANGNFAIGNEEEETYIKVDFKTGNVDIKASGKVSIQGGEGAKEIARKGDSVSVSLTSGKGTITGGSAKAECG